MILYTSCGRPECTNHREVFNSHQPDDAAYRYELVLLIDSSGKDAFDYWIADYVKKGDRVLMPVNIQNEHVCAILPLDITEYRGLEQFRKVEGNGYRGAGLTGIEYDIVKDDSTIHFNLKEIGHILD